MIAGGGEVEVDTHKSELFRTSLGAPLDVKPTHGQLGCCEHSDVYDFTASAISSTERNRA